MLLDFHRKTAALVEEVISISRARGEIQFSESPAEMADQIYHEIRGSMLINIVMHDGRGLKQRINAYLKRTPEALRKR